MFKSKNYHSKKTKNKSHSRKKSKEFKSSQFKLEDLNDGYKNNGDSFKGRTIFRFKEGVLC